MIVVSGEMTMMSQRIALAQERQAGRQADGASRQTGQVGRRASRRIDRTKQTETGARCQDCPAKSNGHGGCFRD